MLPGRRQDKKKLQPSVRFTHCWTIVEIIVCRHHTYFQGNKWVQNKLYRFKNCSPVKFYLSNPIKWCDLLDEVFFTHSDFSLKHFKKSKKNSRLEVSANIVLLWSKQLCYGYICFCSENLNRFAKKDLSFLKTPENWKYISRNTNISFFRRVH